MRRVRRSLDRALLPVYERIIEFYCPYVLVRCSRYTNGRRQAQQIGAYTLISACLVAREVGHRHADWQDRGDHAESGRAGRAGGSAGRGLASGAG